MTGVEMEQSVKEFADRLDNGCFWFDRAMNCGEDYVESGRAVRDTKALYEFMETDLFKKVCKTGEF